MEKSLLQLKNEPPLNRITEKLDGNVRYLTFNVNGIKTLFNHHPWNLLRNGLGSVLTALSGDIVSLQELKIQLGTVAERSLAEGYKSFILVLRAKKGYSGVGLYVREPSATDSPAVRQALTVVKAEEGITGYIKDVSGVLYRDLLPAESIGGYLSEEELETLGTSTDDLVALDSEGRCVMVELANKTVVVSLYCPANSQGTEEGHKFRIHFLSVMLQRCAKLRLLGKHVVIMGDINVSPDLIDNAECINDRLKEKVIVNYLREGGDAFEAKNFEECLAFRSSTEHREILNNYVVPTLKNVPLLETHSFYDTTRVALQRKLNLYTVWNTQTNARQSNFGSRIDLILVSSKEDVDNISNADILPFILGSDHCPVFTDIDVTHQVIQDYTPKKLSFEAHSFYKLVKHYDISSIFSKTGTKAPTIAKSVVTEPKKRPALKPASKSVHTDRKRSKQLSQQPINNFFFSNRTKVEEVKKPYTVAPHDVISEFALKVYTKPPSCEHNEPCISKTSMTQNSRGKKFWCCSRTSKGSSVELGEHRCNFFEWVKRPTD